MSVAKSFKNSDKGKMLARAVEHFGGDKADFEAIIASCLADEILKPSKAKDPKDSSASTEKKEKKANKYRAFQRWCKIFAIWEGLPKYKRKQMKAIWKAYSKEELDAWQRVAEEMEKGTNLREILNKPEIVVPDDYVSDDESGSESEGESDGED